MGTDEQSESVGAKWGKREKEMGVGGMEKGGKKEKDKSVLRGRIKG